MRATVSIVLGMMLVACGGTASEENASRISQRIVGGSQSTSAQDATVYLSIGADGTCTGTLITPNLVLTARHCVSEYGWGGSELCGEFTHDLPASIVRIHLGVDAQYAAAASWAKKIHRPAGNDGCDDIAIVELHTPVTHIKPSPVRFTVPAVGEVTSTVGYGENGYGWVREKRWQRANLQVQGIGPTTYSYVTKHGWSIPVELPAKTIATGESTCYGDSGGPLFDASGAIIGITSRGIDDYCVDRPTLYTATSSFETFIRSAAAAAGHPLEGETQPPVDPPSEPDPEPEPRVEKSTKGSTDDDSETEGLDDASMDEEAIVESAACSASPKPAQSNAAFAAFALAAAIAIVARRRAEKTAKAKNATAASIAFTIAGSLSLVACSSTPPYAGTPLAGSNVRDDDSMDDEDLNQASLEDPDGSPSSSSSGSSGKAQGACGDEASQTACFECCKAESPRAVEIYTAALEACLCESPGACKTACDATLCSGYKADATCAACLRDAGSSCEDAAFTKCEADPECKGLLDCATESQCSAK